MNIAACLLEAMHKLMLLLAHIAMHLNVLWARNSIQINPAACLFLVVTCNRVLLYAHFLHPYEPYCLSAPCNVT
jgi:hypothetical protein